MGAVAVKQRQGNVLWRDSEWKNSKKGIGGKMKEKNGNKSKKENIKEC